MIDEDCDQKKKHKSSTVKINTDKMKKVPEEIKVVATSLFASISGSKSVEKTNA